MAALQTQDVPLFQYIAGQPVPGGVVAANATDIDTNMPAPGSLPLGHQFLIYSVQIIFDEADSDAAGCATAVSGNTKADNSIEGMAKWENIMYNTLFQLRIEQSKSYVEGLLQHFPSGGGMYFIQSEFLLGGAAMTPSPVPDVWNSYVVNNGWPGWDAARRLALPIHIGSLESFRGVLRFPRGALCAPESPDKEWGITVRLTGPRQRPAG
jgi:hypothetical protein